jgi:hypothetical protein
MRILESVLILALGGAQAEPARGPLRAHPDNPRYFADPSGKAVLLTGSHTWQTFQDIGPAGHPPYDYAEYLSLLKTWNHNFFRLWLWEHAWSKGPVGGEVFIDPVPYERPGPGTALDGRPRLDLRRFNAAYFDRLRERVRAAGERGIYVGIILFVSECVKKCGNVDPLWPGHPFHRDNNVNGIDGDPDGDGWGVETQTLKIPSVTALQKEFVRKVIDAVNDLDNVLYEIGNECTGGAANVEWQYEMIRFVREVESRKPKRHPVGMTGAGPRNEDLFRSAADWVSPDRSAAAPYSYLTNPPPADGSKVVVPDTDHMGGAGHYDRSWVWKSFLRGHNPIYMDVLVQTFPLLGKVERNNFHDRRRLPLRRAMGHARSYAERVDLAALTPREDVSSTGYALVSPGKEVLAYQPKDGEFSVALKAGTYAVEWFDVTQGVITRGEPVSVGEGAHPFRPPFPGEAVLYLKKGARP